MTPQVQVWVHLDAGDNAASLVVKLQELIRKVREQGKTAYAFVIWTYGEELKDEIAKLGQEKKIEDIALCYLPSKRREDYLRLYKVETSWSLRNIVFVYRNQRLSSKFINLDTKDFGKVEEALKAVLQ